MLQVQTSIEIAATAERVWQILTDFAAYPAWNPFVRSIAGEQRPGSQLSVTIQPVGGRAMPIRPKLLVFDTRKELRWKGMLLFPGIFDGEHYFQLTEPAPGRVLLSHGEIFSGMLVPLVMRGSLRSGTERGFAAMNEALRQRAEAQ
jgi:hypothetical protein